MKTKTRSIQSVAILVVAVTLIGSYQNCTAGFEANSQSSALSLSSPLAVSTPTVVDDSQYNHLDPATFYGSSRCTNSTFFFCQDFESGVIDANYWWNAVPSSEIEAVNPARGANSLHMTNTGPAWMMVNGDRLPKPNMKYYGRLFVYLDSLPPSAHVSLADAMGDMYSGTEARISIGAYQDGNYYLSTGTDGGPYGDGGMGEETDMGPLPMKKWFCLEWMHDKQNNEVRVWRDSTERQNLHMTSANAAAFSRTSLPYELPDLNYIYIGYRDYWGGAFDVRIDEVALDTKRIGCAR